MSSSRSIASVRPVSRFPFTSVWPVFLQYCPLHRCYASLRSLLARTKMVQMPNRSSNRPELRLLGSFRNFAVGSFRKSLASALCLQHLFADYFHQGAERFRKIFEILRTDQSWRERIGAVFVERRSPWWAQQQLHEFDGILLVRSVLEHSDPPRDAGAWNGNCFCALRCSQSR